MREYINRLSRGKFIYDCPRITEPSDTIRINVVIGRIHNASFHMHATDTVKGIVYVSDSRVSMKHESFSGTDCNMHFRIDARELKEKELIQGSFVIVSNAGEKEIPFVITGVPEGIDTTLGMAYNLFHFTNLVHASLEEARALFQSPNFKRIFLKDDLALQNQYDALFDEEHIDHAIEEFLIVIKKKTPVDFTVGEHSRVYADSHDNEKDIVDIKKSGWGYISLSVSCDADFIEIPKTIVTSDDFTGDQYEMAYIIHADKMHAGRNYARITIASFKRTEKIDIEVFNTSAESGKEETDLRRERQNAMVRLTKEYLDFRMKNVRRETWLSRSNKILERIRGINASDLFFELAQAQLYFISGRMEEGNWILDNIKGDVFDNISGNAELYCYYLYVNTLAQRSEDYTKGVIKTVTDYYEHGHDSWKILWILFYLNADSDHNKSIKLIRIKDAFNNGCVSPVMYLEAANIINAQPVLLRVLNRFEIQVIYFACKYNLVSERLAMQISSIMANEKTVSLEMIGLLKKLYKKYDSDEILTVLVTHMVRANISDEDSFSIYEKGVLRGLRITRLYEFYMASIKKNIHQKISKMVLMYFAYDSQPSWNPSFLYANIVRNKSDYRDIYKTYLKNIEIYVYEQMKAGAIDDYLVRLYKEFVNKQMIREDTAEFLARLRFLYRICISDENVTAVQVNYYELAHPRVYEVRERVAYVPLYTENCRFSFICRDGLKRKQTIHYEIEKVFEEPGDLADFAAFDIFKDELLVYMAHFLRKKQTFDANTLNVYKRALHIDGITDDFKMTLNVWMIDYYAHYYHDDNMIHEYTWIVRDNLGAGTASKLIELLTDFGLYKEAYELVCEYGFVYIAPTKLFKLAVHQLELSGECDAYKSGIVKTVFFNHLYNDLVLSYMLQYFNGTNDEMYAVWKASLNFGMDVNVMSERVIAQMLFTGVHNGRLTEVFAHYYHQGAGGVVVKAYAAYNAYLYLVKQRKANDIVFKVIEDACRQDLGLPDICLVAWLKNQSKHLDELGKQDKKMLAQKLLNELCREDEIYNFYKEFKGILRIPYNAVGVTVIQYHANPESRVTIHYIVNDSSADYQESIMKCGKCGIFTFRITLFYNDKIKYYFTVSGEGEEVTTDYFSFQYSDVHPDVTEGRYDALNDCLASMELQDMVTLKKLMHSYYVEDYVTKQLFKPMKG